MSSDERKLSGDLSTIEGNLGNSIGSSISPHCANIDALTDALADPEIDAVDICLPTDLHPASRSPHCARASTFWSKSRSLSATPMPRGPYAKRSAAAASSWLARSCASFRRTRNFAERLSVVPSAPRFSAGAALRPAGAPGSPTRRAAAAASSTCSFTTPITAFPSGACRDSVRATGYEDLAAGIDIIHAELSYPELGPVVITGGWHHPKSYPFSMEFTVVTGAATIEWQSGAPALRRYTPAGQQLDHPLERKRSLCGRTGLFRPKRSREPHSRVLSARTIGTGCRADAYYAGVSSRKGETNRMPDVSQLEPLEIGVMFWAGTDPEGHWENCKRLGVRCGQLGIPGDLDPACGAGWRKRSDADRVYRLHGSRRLRRRKLCGHPHGSKTPWASSLGLPVRSARSACWMWWISPRRSAFPA